MQAIIKKLEFKKIKDGHYIRIKLVDENGVKHSINNPFLSDDINFRRLVFGILSACGNFDFMRLATSNPENKKMIGFYQNGLQILENSKGEWFAFNKKTGLYECKKPNKETRKSFDMMAEQNICDLRKDEGIIRSITSQSGTFQLFFTSKVGGTYFTTGQIYYGFGYPLTIGSNANPNNTILSAKMFISFIESLMKLYGINDFLKFGGNIEAFPTVDIELNHDHEITTITNPTTGMGFSIGTEYEIINSFEQEKQKRKQLF